MFSLTSAQPFMWNIKNTFNIFKPKEKIKKIVYLISQIISLPYWKPLVALLVRLVCDFSVSSSISIVE